VSYSALQMNGWNIRPHEDALGRTPSPSGNPSVPLPHEERPSGTFRSDRRSGKRRCGPGLAAWVPAVTTVSACQHRLSTGSGQVGRADVPRACPQPRWVSRRDLHCEPPDRASEAILGPRRRADNSGLSAHRPPAETHKRTAFSLIYLQNRRSTTELRPHAYLCLGSPKQAKMSSRSTEVPRVPCSAG
jgi:hypothetical protein